MTTRTVGVAISTTGDKHRLRLLESCVEAWGTFLPEDANMFITVDGDEDAVARAAEVVSDVSGGVFRVGQPWPEGSRIREVREGRLGVAVNKNTGLELLMDNTQVEHLFLSDDDTWPLEAKSLDLHIDQSLSHSMVCWGAHRLEWTSNGDWAEWGWPRGSMIYVRRSVVEKVGGMIEAFGPGGHEHVEWSRRIYQAGLTPALFPSPLAYAHEPRAGGQIAMAAGDYWHAEDMPETYESMASYSARKRRITSVRRQDGDWEMIDKIMSRQDGDTSFKPYTAGDNGRASATLYHSDRA